MELGVVDLDGSRETQVAAMRAACGDSGFFRIPLSAVPRSIVDDAWETATAFFSLSDDVKREVEFPEPGYPYGYSPFAFERLSRSIGGPAGGPDLKESFSVGPDCGRVVSDDEGWIGSPSRWPSTPAGLRPAWEAYYRALGDVAAHLMSLMALALDLPEDYFAPLIDRPITSMRAINYPALPEPPAREAPRGATDRSLRAGAHTDYGTLTILRTDDVSGLEIRRPDGSWVAVEPDEDTFVVNLGDSIAQWTNDRWQSTMHRVSLADRRRRQSIAFFHMANWDAVIRCLPTCRSAGEPERHAPVQAGPWLMRKFQATVT